MGAGISETAYNTRLGYFYRNNYVTENIPADKAVKVIMTTALNEEKNVKMAFELGCTIYSGKPIDQVRFEQALKKLGLVE